MEEKLEQVSLTSLFQEDETAHLLQSWERYVEEVEEIIGYKFKNSNLLYQAFTHSSFQQNCCDSYERLEYVGDSVLNLLIAKEHYFLHPDLPPGKLTRLRAANVDTEKLARVAVKYDFHKYLRHKKPLLKGQVEEFRDATLEYPLHSTGLIDPPKVVEGLLQPLITPTNLETHPVTKFYEVCQKNGWRVELVDKWEETGEIEVFVDGKFVGKGKFSGKKLIALNRAAHNAYCQIVKNLSVEATSDNSGL
ncbi:ribonuclease 3-like protein 3 isoform X2 [Nicotiana tabacum]|uniref:Ribonuclease 3-like protein 3 isoform X2 n=2 Tax=Nicotiana tabacum TaxID=4097 RepID=A0AC58SGB1_TOBAC|nr:PREDICTED: ribonuclease 3-like protein 3 isoform X2 [Nicotiana tabacum]